VFTLDHVVPWGRSFDEYQRMFRLTDVDLHSCILGCADGPASFNAEATSLGFHVVSCDPLYRWQTDQIRQRIQATSAGVLEQVRKNAHEFVWDTIQSVEALGALRLATMERFLEDFESGKRRGRYIEAELPSLPFASRSFDLAVCSHFLFLYTAQLSEAFHLAAVREMCRIAAEVRVFPLLALGGRPSEYVPTIVDNLRSTGDFVCIETVEYEFRRGGNQMLRVRAV
jgi:hypothetical protein